jgi:hypothetical protein
LFYHCIRTVASFRRVAVLSANMVRCREALGALRNPSHQKYVVLARPIWRYAYAQVANVMWLLIVNTLDLSCFARAFLHRCLFLRSILPVVLLGFPVSPVRCVARAIEFVSTIPVLMPRIPFLGSRSYQDRQEVGARHH